MDIDIDAAAGPALLRSIAILASLPDVDLDRLAASARWIAVSKDEPVLTHLDRGDSIFFIVKGQCRVRLSSAIGRAVAFRPLAAGSHFGEIAALTGAPRTVDIIADGECLLAECPREAFDALMASSASFAHAVAVSLARTVVSLTERVFSLSALEVRFRIYGELLRLAKTGQATDEGVLIANAPTHETIAAMIGSQREAVTKELNYLGAEGLIRQEKNAIVLLDIDKMRAFVERRAGVTTSQTVDWPL